MDSGQTLKALREEAGLTQTEVAAAMGTHQSYLSVLEAKAIVRRRTSDRYRSAVQRITNTQQPKDAA